MSTMLAGTAGATRAPLALDRPQAEDFLFREARLLDEWKLLEWAALFTEDGQYLVPPLDAPDSDPSEALFLVYDDHHRLTERAKRLLKKQAHAEYPHSRLRRIVGNVIVEPGDDDAVQVSCNFTVWRSRAGGTEVFPGHSVYQLVVRGPGDIRIRSKRAVIDSDSLRAQRRLSIIL